MFRKAIYILTVSNLLMGTAFAQKNLSEEVSVIRPYKPILAEAIKINTNPEIKFEEQGKNVPEYHFLSHRIDSMLTLNPASIEKMKSESISKLSRNYVRLAGGNYLSSYLEIWHTNLRSKEWSLGAHAKHRASKGSVDNMDFSNQNIDLFATRMYSKQTIRMKALYERDVRHFYGYDHSVFDFKPSDVRQKFDFFGFQSEILSNNENKKENIVYNANFDFYSTKDAFNANENRFSISGYGAYKEYQSKIGIDLAKHEDSLSQENNLFYIEPSIHLEQYGLNVDLGFNAYQEFGSVNRLHLYPKINLEYTLTEIDAQLSAGLDGRMRKQSFRDFYKQNPFLTDNIRIENTNEKLHLYARIRGRIDVKNAYSGSIQYYSLSNEAYFVSDTNVYNSYKVIYDGPKASVTDFNIDFSHQSNNKLRLLAGFRYSIYKTDTLREAYHRPNTSIRLGADYNIANKFLLEAQLYSYSGMKAPDRNGTIQDLKGGVDLNLGIDYRYSKIISVYLNLNNVLNYKREQYLYYSGYGFQAMLGASFRF